MLPVNFIRILTPHILHLLTERCLECRKSLRMKTMQNQAFFKDFSFVHLSSSHTSHNRFRISAPLTFAMMSYLIAFTGACIIRKFNKKKTSFHSARFHAGSCPKDVIFHVCIAEISLALKHGYFATTM